MRAEGNQVPQFCFWAFNGPVITVVQDLYDKIYKPGKHKDLWFIWDGKPLLLYNGTPSSDANGKGVPNPNPHYEAAAKTDPKNPHYGDPDYTEEFYKDYTKEVKELLHPAHHVVGILGMGRQTLRRNGRQLEFWSGPGRQAGGGDEPG